jgi:glycine betaine/proline transport system substrate-binding protein
MRDRRQRPLRPGLTSWSRPGVIAVLVCLVLGGCTGGNASTDGDATPIKKTAPTPRTTGGRCGDFSIAYDPSNGYEASAFIVGTLATDELGCDVHYVKTTSRKAWRLVARGDADVYLDAYGSSELAAQLTVDGGPVTRLGPNGFSGGVDLLAPAFMGDLGLRTYRDLPDTSRIGWGQVPPSITTVPALMPLARSFVDFQQLDYLLRDYSQVGLGDGMGGLLQQARTDNDQHRANLYLVEGPRALIGDGPGRRTVEIPGSAADDCQPNKVSTLCSLQNFRYQKIVNSDFAKSGSPAYNLVYHYKVDREEADNLLEIVELSKYDVRSPDVASWINTHRHVWKHWLG